MRLQPIDRRRPPDILTFMSKLALFQKKHPLRLENLCTTFGYVGRHADHPGQGPLCGGTNRKHIVAGPCKERVEPLKELLRGHTEKLSREPIPRAPKRSSRAPEISREAIPRSSPKKPFWELSRCLYLGARIIKRLILLRDIIANEQAYSGATLLWAWSLIFGLLTS